MKTKKAKLTLKKSTIANLNDIKLARVLGGNTLFCVTIPWTGCKQCDVETDLTEPIVCPDPITYNQTCQCVTEPPEYTCVTNCPYVTCQ